LSLEIGIVPEPETSLLWPQIRAYLQPAADLHDGIIRTEGRLVWGVMEHGQLLAAATARLTVAGDCEVNLVGGRAFRRWLKPLDEAIGRCAREAGARRMIAFGRPGWAKVLKWQVLGRDGDTVAYGRNL
jgi:hypothetical protein